MTSEYFLSLLRNGGGLSIIEEENLSMTSEDVRFLEVLDGAIENPVYFSNKEINPEKEKRALLPRPRREKVKLFLKGNGNGSVGHEFEEVVDGELEEEEDSDYEEIDDDPIYLNVEKVRRYKTQSFPNTLPISCEMRNRSDVETMGGGTDTHGEISALDEYREDSTNAIEETESIPDNSTDDLSIGETVMGLVTRRFLMKTSIESLQVLKRRLDAAIALRTRGANTISES